MVDSVIEINCELENVNDFYIAEPVYTNKLLSSARKTKTKLSNIQSWDLEVLVSPLLRQLPLCLLGLCHRFARFQLSLHY